MPQRLLLVLAVVGLAAACTNYLVTSKATDSGATFISYAADRLACTKQDQEKERQPKKRCHKREGGGVIWSGVGACSVRVPLARKDSWWMTWSWGK